ncbi:MAG: TlpA family protein disulfide reductase [Chitinophagales bacterium]|nr:TlpA family protein disulfide reductase [Chitinophagales bacterium]
MKKLLLFISWIPFILWGQETNYQLYIQSDLDEWLPARMSFVNENDKQQVLNIRNAGETIRLQPAKIINDTLFYNFIDYNAEISFIQGANGIYSGQWINFEDSHPQKREVIAFPVLQKLSPIKTINTPFQGNWKAKIIRSDKDIPALLIIHQELDKVFGTIRTNSGDYRYLEGVTDGENFYLSTFSGNSAFYLDGKIEKDTIRALIHGLTTNTTRFEAVQDESYQLPDGDKLTKIVNDLPFQLDLKNADGIEQNFQNLIKGKVAIVSIFGTWCPNCVDETNYFVELIKKFPELKIISVSFEYTDKIDVQQQRVKGFITRKNIDKGITFLLAGKTGSENVLKKFPMIDQLRAYPTSFLINKKGKIVAVHTGFNGPATGVLYENYKEDFEGKIKTLLAE